MIVLFGSLFVGTTAVQGKVLKIPIEIIEVFDFTGFIPGETWETGGVMHETGTIYQFYFIAGPVDGILRSGVDMMNFKLDTGVGVGTGWNELIGTWIGDDQFNGLPIYWYGHSAFRTDGEVFYGWANTHGTLGDYKIHFVGDYGPAPPQWGWATIITGVLTIHL